MRRYAEGTTVPVETTVSAMKRLLQEAGATHWLYAETPDGSAVQFSLGGYHYRIVVQPPSADALRQEYIDEAVKRGREHRWTIESRADRVDWRTKVAAEWKRRWRARLLWLKAQIEFAEGDEGQLPRALMAYLVLPDGRTFETWAVPQIEDMYADGTMPPLLGTGQ